MSDKTNDATTQARTSELDSERESARVTFGNWLNQKEKHSRKQFDALASCLTTEEQDQFLTILVVAEKVETPDLFKDATPLTKSEIRQFEGSTRSSNGSSYTVTDASSSRDGSPRTRQKVRLSARRSSMPLSRAPTVESVPEAESEVDSAGIDKNTKLGEEETEI